MEDRRVAKLRFRACAACRPCSQASLCLSTSSAISIRAKLTLIGPSVTLWEGSAPEKLPARHCLEYVFRTQLDTNELKMSVSLTTPSHPETRLQSLLTTLRIRPLVSIPSYSKASGVFSSSCRYPASSRESHFHRAVR